MADYIYMDNSNTFIEGQKALAVKSGEANSISEAMNEDIKDKSFRLDFGRLHDFLVGSDEVKRCVIFGSRPHDRDTIWNTDVAKSVGFEVVVERRNAANKEKRVDTGIVALMVKDAYKHADPKKDTFTLVAGDGDFVPVVEMLVEDGYCVEVVFWSHAAADLKRASSKFVNLTDHISYLQYNKKRY